MAKGFRDFLLRGNIVELSVAVVIGSAFTAVVTAVTTSLLQPLINIFLGGGISGGKYTLHGQVFDFGGVLNAIITFVIIAAVVYFLVIAPLRRLMPVKEAPPPAETEASLLVQIRDLLRAQSGR